jgi:hypothetical protein
LRFPYSEPTFGSTPIKFGHPDDLSLTFDPHFVGLEVLQIPRLLHQMFLHLSVT